MHSSPGSLQKPWQVLQVTLWSLFHVRWCLHNYDHVISCVHIHNHLSDQNWSVCYGARTHSWWSGWRWSSTRLGTCNVVSCVVIRSKTNNITLYYYYTYQCSHITPSSSNPGDTPEAVAPWSARKICPHPFRAHVNQLGCSHRQPIAENHREAPRPARDQQRWFRGLYWFFTDRGALAVLRVYAGGPGEGANLKFCLGCQHGQGRPCLKVSISQNKENSNGTWELIPPPGPNSLLMKPHLNSLSDIYAGLHQIAHTQISVTWFKKKIKIHELCSEKSMKMLNNVLSHSERETNPVSTPWSRSAPTFNRLSPDPYHILPPIVVEICQVVFVKSCSLTDRQTKTVISVWIIISCRRAITKPSSQDGGNSSEPACSPVNVS